MPMGRGLLAVALAGLLGSSSAARADYQLIGGDMSGEAHEWRTGFTSATFVLPTKSIVNGPNFQGGHITIAQSGNPPDNGHLQHFLLGPTGLEVWGYNELDYSPGNWGGYD